MVDQKVLITYASMSGSTQEIAEYVAGELINLGLSVDLQACRLVRDVHPYHAVILGAPLYMFHLHKDAQRFLQRFQKQLPDLPVAVFAGGPYGVNAATDMLDVRKNLSNELAKFAWLHPVSVQMVGGRFDPARLRFPYNLIPALKQAPPEDARDWDEIRTWAHSLPNLLRLPTNV